MNRLMMMRSNLALANRFLKTALVLVTNWQINSGMSGISRVRDLKTEIGQLRTCMVTQATYIEELHEARAVAEAAKEVSRVSTPHRPTQEALMKMSSKELLQEIDRLYSACDEASSRGLEMQQQAALETQCYVVEVEKEFHLLQNQLHHVSGQLLRSVLRPITSNCITAQDAVRTWRAQSGRIQPASASCSLSPKAAWLMSAMELENDELKCSMRRLESYVANTDVDALENENEVLRSSVRHFKTELEAAQEEVAMWNAEMEERTALVEARIMAEKQASANRLRRTCLLYTSPSPRDS